MIVWMTSELVQQANPLDLCALMGVTRAGKHLLLARSDARKRFEARCHELGPLLADQMKQQLDEDKRRYHRSVMKCEIRIDHIHTSDWEKARLTIQDAVPFLMTPLLLMVENRNSDGAFLRAFLGKQDGQELEQLLDSGRVRFENGGGVSVMLSTLAGLRAPFSSGELDVIKTNAPTGLAFLEKGHEYFRPMCSRHWRERLRLWVMFDRDRDDENLADIAAPSFMSEAIRGLCLSMTAPWPMPHHQHVRRAIENYLPESALKSWAKGKSERKNRLDSLLRNPARHHLDLKDELGDKHLWTLFRHCDNKALEREVLGDQNVKAFRERLMNSIRENL